MAYVATQNCWRTIGIKMNRLLRKLHLWGCYKRFCFFLINHVFVRFGPLSSKIKCGILRSMDFKIGKGTTIVSPMTVLGNIQIGDNCWINRGFTVHGDGNVIIGNNCDIAPDVVFLTGGHAIGSKERRAGEGEVYTIEIGDGSWIGSRATILGNTRIGHSCVIAACACVVHDVPDDTLVGGVPARTIRSLDNEHCKSDQA